MLELIHKGRYYSDVSLSNILKISDLSKISRSEKRLRDYLLASYNDLAKISIENAFKLIIKGESPYNIFVEIENNFSDFSKNVKIVVNEEIKFIYFLSRKISFENKLNSFVYTIPKLIDIKKSDEGYKEDEEIYELLIAMSLFWIGANFSKNLSFSVANAIEYAFKKSLNSKTVRDKNLKSNLKDKKIKELTKEEKLIASKILKEELGDLFNNIRSPNGFNGTKEQYIDGISAVIATNTRNFAHLKSFKELKFKNYKIEAAKDEKTCGFCSHMDGKIFSLEDGLNLQNKMLKIDNFDDIEDIQPWISYSELKKLSPNKGDVHKEEINRLVEKGILLPPFHLRCRCVIISVD